MDGDITVVLCKSNWNKYASCVSLNEKTSSYWKWQTLWKECTNHVVLWINAYFSNILISHISVLFVRVIRFIKWSTKCTLFVFTMSVCHLTIITLYRTLTVRKDHDWQLGNVPLLLLVVSTFVGQLSTLSSINICRPTVNRQPL